MRVCMHEREGGRRKREREREKGERDRDRERERDVCTLVLMIYTPVFSCVFVVLFCISMVIKCHNLELFPMSAGVVGEVCVPCTKPIHDALCANTTIMNMFCLYVCTIYMCKFHGCMYGG
jgi:hypothetical protein